MAKTKATKKSTGAAAKPLSPMERVEQFLNTKYDFRYNEVTGKVEAKTKADQLFHPVSDYFLNSLARQMIKAGVPCGITLLRNVLMSDYTPVFNPFRKYLEELPPWDGITDYILQLSQTVSTTDDPLWQLCFKKWLVAMVGSLISDDVINHTVIVFSGRQGIGIKRKISMVFS